MIALPLMRKALQQAPNGVLSEEKAEEVLKTCMKVLFYRDARSINKVRWPTTYALSLLHADESSAFPVPNRKSDKERSGHLGQHERGYLLAICRQIARVRCSDAVMDVTSAISKQHEYLPSLYKLFPLLPVDFRNFHISKG